MLMILFSLTTLVSAQEGCFFFPDSPAYCQTVSMEQAQQECFFFTDCDLSRDFFIDKNCNDLSQFPSCRKILCKSSCTFEFAGSCPAGEVPETEIESWCSSGCCWFEYSNKLYCGEQSTQWRCQVQAKNKEAPSVGYDSSANPSQCLQFCKGLNLQNYNDSLLSPVPLSVRSSSESMLVSPPTTISSEQGEDTVTSTSSWWWMGLILIGLIILFLVKSIRRESLYFEDEEEQVIRSVSKTQPLPNTILQKHNFHKLKQHQRERFFISSGMEPEKITSFKSFFARLKRFSQHKKPKPQKEVPPPEKKPTVRLFELISPKTEQTPPVIDKPASSKLDQSGPFSRLAKISQKK